MAEERSTLTEESGIHPRTELEDRLERAVETAMGVPFLEGNRVRVLRNGDAIFPAMLEVIEGAREYIDFLSYVYWQGDIAVRFAHALAAKSREGVDVRVLLDGIGAAPMDRALVELMKEAGAKVYFFRKPTTWRVWRTSHRTHRKVLICDGQVAFTGGVGIADEWCGDARNPSEWRDTHIEIRGPAVAGLQAAFSGNWVEEHRDISELHRKIDRRPRGNARVMSIRSTASIGWSDVATLLWTLIANAQERIRIATAYFVPDDRTVELLCDTARRGVSVEILIPGPHTDQRACSLAHAPVVEPLLEAGVAIYRYQPTMMHAKIVIVDSYLAMIGSPNVNHRSMQQDDECCTLVIDDDAVATLERHFDEDIERSRRGTLATWERRSWWRRVLELLVRPFTKQL